MVLPLIFGALGSGLAASGALSTLGLGALASPLVAGSIGSGLGAAIETGDLEKGILTGLGSFAGGSILGPMMGKMGGAGAAGGAAPMVSQGAKDAITAATASAAGPQGGIGGLLGKGAMGDAARSGLAFAKTPTGLGALAGRTVANLAFPTGSRGGDREEDKKSDYRELRPIPRNVMNPPAGYRPGFDPEWNYGISDPQTAADIRAYNVRRFASGGGIGEMATGDVASGGIADLMAQSGENEKTIVVDAIRAIKGEIEDPRIPLGKFVAAFGEDALRDLVDTVEGGGMGGGATSGEKGMVRGPGDGMNDRVPARIAETGEDVLLADSEYVVPADVVSHLGNGSSEAGSKVLDRMLDRVREARTGRTAQAPQIAPEKVIPA